jgi:hypothetical protein
MDNLFHDRITALEVLTGDLSAEVAAQLEAGLDGCARVEELQLLTQVVDGKVGVAWRLRHHRERGGRAGKGADRV